MRRVKIHQVPAEVSTEAFDELYDYILKEPQPKLRRLEIRRWRKLKHQSI